MELKYFEDRHEVVKLHNKNPFIKSDLERQVYQIEQEGFRLNLEGYEHANLVRLGLIKQLPPKIFIEEFRTGGYPDEYTEKWHQIDAEYNLDSSGYRVTDLGEKFIEVCELGK